jgi:hypothetical protein
VTRGDIKTMIQAAGHGTDTDSAQSQAIQEAFQEVVGRRTWTWNEAVSTTATVAIGDNSVNNMPTDIDFIDDVFLEVGADYKAPLTRMDAQELLSRAHEDRVNDIPLYYTEYEGSLLLHPRPVAAYTITIHYHKVPALPTTDAWVPPFPEAYHEVLAFGALRLMAYRQRDWQAYSVADATYRMILRDMETSDRRGEQSDSVEPWDGWTLVK